MPRGGCRLRVSVMRNLFRPCRRAPPRRDPPCGQPTALKGLLAYRRAHGVGVCGRAEWLCGRGHLGDSARGPGVRQRLPARSPEQPLQQPVLRRRQCADHQRRAVRGQQSRRVQRVQAEPATAAPAHRPRRLRAGGVGRRVPGLKPATAGNLHRRASRNLIRKGPVPAQGAGPFAIRPPPVSGPSCTDSTAAVRRPLSAQVRGPRRAVRHPGRRRPSGQAKSICEILS